MPTSHELIYLDHAATTPVHPRVVEAMLPYLTERFFNPSSVYAAAQECRAAIDLARKQVAGVFDTLGRIMTTDLNKPSEGKDKVFVVPGLMKVKAVYKPATKAREGKNPFTGETQMFKAKPAKTVIKIRPLKALKDAV